MAKDVVVGGAMYLSQMRLPSIADGRFERLARGRDLGG